MPYPPKNILAPTDFSDGAEPAVAYAFELAKAVGAKVHVLHAYSIPALPEDGGMTHERIAGLKALGEKKLRELVDKYQATGAVGQLSLKMGDPRDLIPPAITELGVDLVVMGTHGRRGISRVVLGSVAGHMVRTAICPVLVVPMSDKR